MTIEQKITEIRMLEAQASIKQEGGG